MSERENLASASEKNANIKRPDQDNLNPTNSSGETIEKKLSQPANLEDYEKACQTFTWDEAKREIDYFGGGKLNAAYNAVDRQLKRGRKDKVALYSLDAKGQLSKYTFEEIAQMSNRIGNALKELDVKKGDRVFSLFAKSTGVIRFYDRHNENWRNCWSYVFCLWAGRCVG